MIKAAVIFEECALVCEFVFNKRPVRTIRVPDRLFFLRMSDPVHFLRAMYEAFPLNDAILVISLCGMVEESLGIRLSIVKFLPHRSFAPR